MSTDQQIQDAKGRLFSSRSYHGPTVDVHFDDADVVLEVRAPMAKYDLEGAALKFEKLLLECVHLKGTGVPFFTKHDLGALKESAAHPDGIVNRLTKAIQNVYKGVKETTDEEAEKN